MLLPEHKRRKTVDAARTSRRSSPRWRASRRRPSSRRRQGDAAQPRARPARRWSSARTRRSRRWRRRSSCRRAGLRDPEKPIGNYLFSGPTGVGKTEVAKQLASTLGIELIRFDMSEYMERHSRLAPDRRAAGLCRLRPGRPADRRDRPAPARGAAARRDREGASRTCSTSCCR